MKTMKLIYFTVNKGTALEKEIMVEEAYDLNAELKEYNRYYVVKINDNFYLFKIINNILPFLIILFFFSLFQP